MKDRTNVKGYDVLLKLLFKKKLKIQEIANELDVSRQSVEKKLGWLYGKGYLQRDIMKRYEINISKFAHWIIEPLKLPKDLAKNLESDGKFSGWIYAYIRDIDNFTLENLRFDFIYGFAYYFISTMQDVILFHRKRGLKLKKWLFFSKNVFPVNNPLFIELGGYCVEYTLNVNKKEAANAISEMVRDYDKTQAILREL